MRNTALIFMAIAVTTTPALAKPKLTPEQELAQLTKGATPGKPVTCINQNQSLETQRIKGIGVLYRVNGTWYLNRFNNGCSIDSTDIIVTSTPSTQLCRGDIARIVDSTSHFPRASCSFDDFIPYTKAK